MSHGHDLKIVSADGKLLDYYKDILRYRAVTIPCIGDGLSRFFNNNCDVLRNKPKVFIFQACQGEEIDCGVSSKISLPSYLTSTLHLLRN